MHYFSIYNHVFAPKLESNTSIFPHRRLAAPTYETSVPIDELDIHAYYTKDYNMLPRGKRRKVGLQGGVIIVRPNTTTRDILVDMVKTAKYFNAPTPDKMGWFHSGYGRHIYGSMTIQGLLAYYYTEVAHGTSIELNRCRFNQIAENPRRSSYHKDGKYPRGTPIANDTEFHDLECRDRLSNDCDDVQCQTWPMSETFILHFTYCKAPTTCPDASWKETHKDVQCLHMMKKWFDIRKLLAMERNMPPPGGDFYPEWYHGFCNKQKSYVSIPLPKEYNNH